MYVDQQATQNFQTLVGISKSVIEYSEKKKGELLSV